MATNDPRRPDSPERRDSMRKGSKHEPKFLYRVLGGEDRVTHEIKSSPLVRLILGLSPAAVMVLLGGFAITRIAYYSSVAFVALAAVCLLAQWYASFKNAASKPEFMRRQWGWALFSFLMPVTVVITSLMAELDLAIYMLSFWVLLAVLPRSFMAILHTRLCADRPAVSLTLSFASVIIAGSLILTYSPLAGHHGTSVRWIDALFTSTSAVCVTGLESVTTATSFSTFGQAVIMVLIQVGGLGIMTLGSFMLLTAGRRLGFGDRQIMRDALNLDQTGGIGAFVASVIGSTAIIEIIGACCLFPHFRGEDHPVFTSVFHAVSAFCNAGFALFPDNLVRFAKVPSLNITIMVLIVIGGIGFTVIADIVRRMMPKKDDDDADFGRRLSLHTRLVLIMTAILIVTGAAGFFGIERRNGVLRDMSTRDAVIASCFQSVSARTAGFNTVPIAQDKDSKTTEVRSATLLWLTAYMVVGASPGSTGGGVKTVTMAVLILGVAGLLQQRQKPSVFGRSIPDVIVSRAGGIFMVYLLTLFLGVLAMQVFHGQDFSLDQILFECASALGTVGYSAGISGSPILTDAGKCILILLMFAGRLGPLTLVLVAVKARPTRRLVDYPEENVLIG